MNLAWASPFNKPSNLGTKNLGYAFLRRSRQWIWIYPTFFKSTMWTNVGAMMKSRQSQWVFVIIANSGPPLNQHCVFDMNSRTISNVCRKRLKFGPGWLNFYLKATFQTESKISNKIQNCQQNSKWPTRIKKWLICNFFAKTQSNQVKLPTIPSQVFHFSCPNSLHVASATGNLV